MTRFESTSPTMKDVAAAAGVSVMTVSRAFKADASVNAQTRARILAAADRLGYVFDSRGSVLRSRRSGFVAVTIPSLNNANFAETVEALTIVLKAEGFQVLLGYTNYDIHREEELIEELLRRRPEAILVTGGRHTERARRLLAAARIPVIEMWDLPSDPIGQVVGFSNAAAIGLMVDHLAGQGATRIAFIGGDNVEDTRGADRRRGFVAAMEARGLAADRLVNAGAPPVTMKTGGEGLARMIAAFPDTEAVICVSDLSAFGAMMECARRGIAVPGDLAVAGFGAYDIAQICTPTITTIDPHCEQIGRLAGERVVGILRDGAGDAITQVIPVLRVGESTGNRASRGRVGRDSSK